MATYPSIYEREAGWFQYLRQCRVQDREPICRRDWNKGCNIAWYQAYIVPTTEGESDG